MFKILERQDLAPSVHLFKIEAPELARKARPGQFVVVRIDEKGERIPLTFADWDIEGGSITIIFMEVGATTCRLAKKIPGDYIENLVGPLGLPTHIEKFGTVVCVGGGIGIAPITPIAKALKQAGNKVISIMGSRSKNLLFWENVLRDASHETIICTDDGTYGAKGLVTDPLKNMLDSGQNIQRVIAIGPIPMMKFCSLTTFPFKVKTIVSLNALMVDGTGMCGCCRVSVDNSTKFACVDGPDFDGHKVDWDLMAIRSKGYVAEEKISMDHWQCKCSQK